MLVEFTPAEEATLRTLIQERDTNGPTVTAPTLQSALQAANASWQSAPNVQAVVFSGTTLVVERLGRFNYVRAKGATQTATINAITHLGVSAFQEFDEIQVRVYEPGWWLNMQMPGQPQGILMHQADHYITFVLVGGTWGTKSSNPTMQQAWTMPPIRLDLTTATLPLIGSSVSLRYLTAETPATGNVEITTAGVSGSVTAYVDEGYGPGLLGTYSYTGSPTLTAVAAGLAADIQANYTAGNHFYQASNVLGVCNITIPQGRGADANTYLLSVVVTGDCVADADGYGVANGGTDGVDGVEANGTLELIETPLTDGMVIRITNEMAANTIDLVTTGASNIATAKTLQAMESCLLVYSAILARFSNFI